MRLADRSTIRFRIAATEEQTQVLAFRNGVIIGSMTVYNGPSPGVHRINPPGTLHLIEVDEQYRRQGVGTAMWFHAVDSGLNPKYADDRSMTDDGRLWAQAVRRTERPETPVRSRWRKWMHLA